MSNRQISIRLGMEGGADVTRGLDDITRAGTDGFDRMAASWGKTGEAAEKYKAQLAEVAAAAKQAALADEVNSSWSRFLGVSDQVTNSAREAASVFQQAQGETIGWSTALGSATRIAATFGVALSGTALVSWAESLVRSTAELQSQARVAGVSTDALQAFRGAVVQSGGTSDEADAAIRRFTRSLGDAAETMGPARKAFLDLHLTAHDLAGGTEAALPQVAAALLGVKDASERARDEVALFGRAGQDVEAVLRSWADPSIVQNMRDQGLVIDRELIERADKFVAAWNTAWLRFKAEAISGVGGAIAAIGELPQALESLAREKLPNGDPILTAEGQPVGRTDTTVLATAGNAGLPSWLKNLLRGTSYGRAFGIPDVEPVPSVAVPINTAGFPLTQSPVASSESSDYSWKGASKSLDELLAKMQLASQLAAETTQQRAIDEKIIEAATAKLKDQGQDTSVIVSSLQQAKQILGDHVVAQITQVEQQQTLNTLFGQGAERIAQIRAEAGSVTWNQKFIEGLNRLSTETFPGVLTGVKEVSAQQIDLRGGAVADLVQKVQDQAEAAALLPQYRAAELAIIRIEHDTYRQLDEDQKQQIVNAYALAQQYKDIVQTELAMQSTFADWLYQVEQTGQLNFRKLFAGILQDWEKLLDKMIAEQAFQSLFGIGAPGGGNGAVGGLFNSLDLAVGGPGLGGGGAGLLSDIGTALGFHGGGTVGVSAGAQRSAPIAAFMHAPRYHLGVDEVPAILQTGEKVLSRADVANRNVNASGAGAVLNINVTVNGANGDQHVIDLVHQGVSTALTSYDRGLDRRIIPTITKLQKDPRFRG